MKLLFCLISLATVTAWPDDVLEFRLATTNETPGWQRAVSGSDELWLDTNVLISSRQIESATIEQRSPAIDRGILETLKKAHPTLDINAHPELSIQLTPEGRALLSHATAANKGKRLAIISNGKILMAPWIVAPITGGVANVVGINDQEAATIVDTLKRNKEVEPGG